MALLKRLKYKEWLSVVADLEDLGMKLIFSWSSPCVSQ